MAAQTNPQLMRAFDQHDQLHKHYLEIRYEVDHLAGKRWECLHEQDPEKIEAWAQQVSDLYDLLGKPEPGRLRPIRIARELEAELDSAARHRAEGDD